MTEEQWAAAYEQYAPSVKRYMIHRGVRDADDLVQEVFTRAWKSRHLYREQGQLLNWLYRVASGVLVDEVRRFRPTAELEDMHSDPDCQKDLDEAEGELTTQLERSFTRTTRERYLTVLQMDADGYDPREIADRLGMTWNGCRVVMHRARKAAQKVLAA